MKAKTLAGALIAGTSLLAAALPGQSQAELIAGRADKHARPVFKKANWFFDYDDARAEARRQGKLLFTYFTRSYVF
jgi:hypothetical protein